MPGSSEHPADTIAAAFGGGWRGAKYAEMSLEALTDAGFLVVPGPDLREPDHHRHDDEDTR